MSRIFISYSRKDEQFARQLAGALSQRGIDIWMDVEDIPAGMKWSSAIQQGLDSGELMIVIISPDSMASRNVEDEWQYYLDNRKPIIPVLLREAKVHFQLSRIQFVDFLRNDFNSAFQKLLFELQNKGITFTPIPPPVEKKSAEPQPEAATTTSGRSFKFDPLTSTSGLLFWIVVVFILILVATPRTPANNTAVTETITPQATTFIEATPSIALSATNNDAWTPVYRRIGGALMALVPAGTFMMGADDESLDLADDLCKDVRDLNCNRGQGLFRDEYPQTPITFDEPFWIDVTEVTQDAYGSVIQAGGNNFPQAHVTWQQAQTFCESRDARLPNEAEWEYAARGPDGVIFPWGSTTPSNTTANFCDSNCEFNWRDTRLNDLSAREAAVFSYPAGASWVGAQDMAGNLWEWTSTVYHEYPYRETPDDTTSPRTLRGGSWNWVAAELRSTARSAPATGYESSEWYGFRCARDYQDGDLARYPEN